MDRLSQHTSSEPVPSLPRDELDQDYLEPSLDQDLDQDHEQDEDQRLESDSTPSKTVELKVLCTQQCLVSASSFSFLISILWKEAGLGSYHLCVTGGNMKLFFQADLNN